MILQSLPTFILLLLPFQLSSVTVQNQIKYEDLNVSELEKKNEI